jgi:hypothetical protein
MARNDCNLRFYDEKLKSASDLRGQLDATRNDLSKPSTTMDHKVFSAFRLNIPVETELPDSDCKETATDDQQSDQAQNQRVDPTWLVQACRDIDGEASRPDSHKEGKKRRRHGRHKKLFSFGML